MTTCGEQIKKKRVLRTQPARIMRDRRDDLREWSIRTAEWSPRAFIHTVVCGCFQPAVPIVNYYIHIIHRRTRYTARVSQCLAIKPPVEMWSVSSALSGKKAKDNEYELTKWISSCLRNFWLRPTPFCRFYFLWNLDFVNYYCSFFLLAR